MAMGAGTGDGDGAGTGDGDGAGTGDGDGDGAGTGDGDGDGAGDGDNFLVREKDNEGCELEHLRYIRASNPKKLTLGHPNINSIPNKFDGIMDIVSTNLGVFLISETKIDSSFPEAQFLHDGYSKPHRKDRSLGGGGILMYVNNIPSRILNQHTIPDDVEIMCGDKPKKAKVDHNRNLSSSKHE